LGGADVHNRVSGVAHFAARTEAEAFALVRRLLSYLPANNAEDPPYSPSSDPLNRMDEALDELVPQDPAQPYDMREVVQLVVDEGSFLEVQERFAPNLLVGFARMGGHVVGLIAQQPAVLAGVLDVDASDKGARFIRFCDCFNIPLLTFTDTPGFLPGVAQEHAGIIRHGAKMLYAYAEATVPKITLITRKSYGGAYLAMNSKDMGADVVLAWPTAAVAVMGAEGAANIIYRREIERSPDPAATRAQKIEEYKKRFDNPYVAAAKGYIDDVVDPKHTRLALIRHLRMLEGKEQSLPFRKHGNIPL